jgi:phenylalanyl-tRNA synthetase alpha chain
MEAVRIFDTTQLGTEQEDLILSLVVQDLKMTLESLFRKFFGEVPIRWVPAYFPFTNPSFELEMYFQNQWVEMLGCGIIQNEIMKNAGRSESEIGWAAGLGIERFAMKMFDIPDVRLFWSNDSRFLDQFSNNEISKFKPFSKYPSCTKDISMWIPDISQFAENDVYEVIRNIAGDLIEKVELVDEYHDKKKNRHSRCYRIHYRSLERTLVNEEVHSLDFITN